MIIPKPIRGLPRDGWIIQPKWCGVRLIVDTKHQTGLTHNLDRRAVDIDLPLGIFDGEIIGEDYHVFDVLMLGREDVRFSPIERRIELLHKAGICCEAGPLEEMLKLCSQTEGLVSKRPGSAYPMNKRTSDWRKWRWEWGAL